MVELISPNKTPEKITRLGSFVINSPLDFLTSLGEIAERNTLIAEIIKDFSKLVIGSTYDSCWIIFSWDRYTCARLARQHQSGGRHDPLSRTTQPYNLDKSNSKFFLTILYHWYDNQFRQLFNSRFLTHRKLKPIFIESHHMLYAFLLFYQFILPQLYNAVFLIIVLCKYLQELSVTSNFCSHESYSVNPMVFKVSSKLSFQTSVERGEKGGWSMRAT